MGKKKLQSAIQSDTMGEARPSTTPKSNKKKKNKKKKEKEDSSNVALKLEMTNQTQELAESWLKTMKKEKAAKNGGNDSDNDSDTNGVGARESAGDVKLNKNIGRAGVGFQGKKKENKPMGVQDQVQRKLKRLEERRERKKDKIAEEEADNVAEEEEEEGQESKTGNFSKGAKVRVNEQEIVKEEREKRKKIQQQRKKKRNREEKKKKEGMEMEEEAVKEKKELETESGKTEEEEGQVETFKSIPHQQSLSSLLGASKTKDKKGKSKKKKDKKASKKQDYDSLWGDGFEQEPTDTIDLDTGDIVDLEALAAAKAKKEEIKKEKEYKKAMWQKQQGMSGERSAALPAQSELVRSFGKKKRKKRSRQKNLKKDNRPDHLKPTYLTPGSEDFIKKDEFEKRIEDAKRKADERAKNRGIKIPDEPEDGGKKKNKKKKKGNRGTRGGKKRKVKEIGDGEVGEEDGKKKKQKVEEEE